MEETMSTRARKSCLNCRHRKIACDRTLPTCGTCMRRGKECSGYSLSLSWPHAGDTRRAVTANVPSRKLPGPVVFLNTFIWDTSLYIERNSPINHMGVWHIPGPSRSLQTPQFGTYMAPAQYASAIEMITSRGDLRRDVCSLLYRMSLTDELPPSLAVRYSMNAITYLYLQRSRESAYNRMRAVSALREALSQVLDSKSWAQAIAASMLLSIYEAVDRSGMAKNWSVYFDGSLMIVKSRHQEHRSYGGDAATLLDWVFYHNVLYKFSIRHWQQRTVEQERIANREMVISQAIFNPNRHIIQSTLGCSLELLNLLGQAVDLAGQDRNDPGFLSKSHQYAIESLERRLRAIDQQLCSGIDDEEYHTIGSRKHYTAIAQLFQFATLIYLDRVVRGSPISSLVSRAAAEQSFSILRDLGVCERPFPMFILSLQAESDSDRMLMIKSLQRTRKERTLSNLDWTEQMIRRIWAQQDLHGIEDVDALFVINSVISANNAPPSFT
ncbi:fungal-specific transcription factor domain-containing protein [Talaromyces proteolyticus]|uniref:Fungal-specific transcription factor domain-containing protein n=1 Tax=Talaromyces proteolyticus TaxID=1131652 RepID=A0AAD4KN35_9EURO|nr:fungal-specific transcription factor domain-containing protein [Talaromyces proteolyticus]KAH8694085.1 fungal-specific transcription factor domain-containing protein [Talaromyces proteolyticus]